MSTVPTIKIEIDVGDLIHLATGKLKSFHCSTYVGGAPIKIEVKRTLDQRFNKGMTHLAAIIAQGTFAVAQDVLYRGEEEEEKDVTL